VLNHPDLVIATLSDMEAQLKNSSYLLHTFLPHGLLWLP
jgi:hypothetical protein